MAGGCTECKNWEEQMYWSRFGTVHFCQFLTARFDQQLAIPKKFVNNLREKMGETVVLKGPSGHIWNVELVANGDTLCFKHGWKTFVEDHSLEENDILFFRYNGNSSFDVFIFDQELCERAACYFVRKCEHTESAISGSKRKTSSEESLEENDEYSLQHVAEGSRTKKPRNRGARTPPSRNRSTRSTNTKGRGRRGAKRGKKGSRSAHAPVQLKSRRREVTEEEIEKAQKMALEASSQNSFIVVMRASHVYKGFFMSIPAEWAKIHLPKGSQQVVLRMKDKTWKVKYHFKGYGGGLSGGWKYFVMENFLEEFDVCVFDFVRGSQDHNIIFDVKIFRVVEEVIPPSHVTSRGTPSRVTKYVQDSTEEEEEEDDDV